MLSGYKRTTTTNYGKEIDIYAPGVNILSDIPTDRTEKREGTSDAAAFVIKTCINLRGTKNFSEMDGVKLYNGDCLEVMNEIPDNSVNLILCDLPYGTTGIKWNVKIPFDKLWEHYNRVLKPNGTVLLFGSEPFASMVRYSNPSMYKYDWVWEKNNCGNMKRLGLGYNEVSMLFPSRNGLQTGWLSNKISGKQLPTREQWKRLCNLFGIEDEYDKLAVKNTITYNMVLKDVERTLSNKGKGGRLGHLGSQNKRSEYKQTKSGYPKSILKFNRETGFHPTQKPVSLLEFLVKTHSNEGDVVLDNCMGSGSTGVACVNTGRNFVGIEIEKKYFEIAEERILDSEKKLF